MKIGMVLAGIDFPPDIRVEKEAASLGAAGHALALLCSAKKGRPRRTVESTSEMRAAGGAGPISVTRLAPARLGPRRLASSLTTYVSFRYPQWQRELEAWIRDEGVEVLHVHDLPMAETVLDVAEIAGVPVVLDLHENYPAALRAWRRPTTAQRLFGTLERYPRVELDAARRAARVVVVVEEAAERFLAAGIGDEKIVVVSNTEPLAYGDQVGRLERDARFGDDIVLAYAGGFGPHRGLEAVVGAMARLSETDGSHRLVIAGDGPGAIELRAQADAFGLAEHVEFLGWLDADGVRRLVASSDVCLVPHAKSEHTDTTVPHKLFQCMVSGRAVAVTDCAPLARIVGDAGCGVIVPTGRGGAASPDAWAETILSIGDRGAAAALGASGRAACETTYRWEVDGARLVDMYATMASA